MRAASRSRQESWGRGGGGVTCCKGTHIPHTLSHAEVEPKTDVSGTRYKDKLDTCTYMLKRGDELSLRYAQTQARASGAEL